MGLDLPPHRVSSQAEWRKSEITWEGRYGAPSAMNGLSTALGWVGSLSEIWGWPRVRPGKRSAMPSRSWKEGVARGCQQWAEPGGTPRARVGGAWTSGFGVLDSPKSSGMLLNALKIAIFLTTCSEQKLLEVILNKSSKSSWTKVILKILCAEPTVILNFCQFLYSF